MLSKVTRLVKFFLKNPFTVRLYNKYKYPLLSVDASANISIDGEFKYGVKCSISEGANVVVPLNTRLILGDKCRIGRYVELGPHTEIKLGAETSVQDRCIFLGDVSIGKHCLISLNVLISSGQHYYDFSPHWLIRDQDRYVLANSQLKEKHSKPVVIEDDCWIGVNAVIMAGIKIGKGAVIGANSVITKDVEPYCVVAGAPAVVIKKRLDFIPPRNISYSNSIDLPYFYSGFEVSQEAIKSSYEYSGLQATQDFVIALNVAGASSLHIILKSTGESKTFVTYQSTKKLVPSEFTELVFKVNTNTENMLHFAINRDFLNGELLIVQKAWVS